MTARTSINDEAGGTSATGKWLTRLFGHGMAANWPAIDRISLPATVR